MSGEFTGPRHATAEREQVCMYRVGHGAGGVPEPLGDISNK